MNCVNCNSRLFLFNETEELFPGSEMVFCSSCRNKIVPFLEDRNRYATHAEHLAAWERNLTSSGVTPKGLSALSAYCAYLDRITPKKPQASGAPAGSGNGAAPAARQTTALQVVPANDILARLDDTGKRLDFVTDSLRKMRHRLRWAIAAACAGGLASIGSLIAVIASLV